MLADPKQEVLPTATGYEVGARTQILPRTDLSATYWFLDLSSELVFNRDEGTTEAQHREGIKFGATVRVLEWLTAHAECVAGSSTSGSGEPL